METFSVVSPGTLIPTIALIVLGVVVAAAMLSHGRTRANMVSAVMVLMIIVASGAVVWYVSNPRPATIAVGSGQFTISAQEIGTCSYGVSDVRQAYVTAIGSGVLSSISRQHGERSGSYYIGVFSLANGKTAYMISENPMNLVVQLNDGMYLVLAPGNFTSFVNYFAENVASVANLTS